MAIKPTPTKMVLLMSAAGLGLSWPGVGLASRDTNTLPSFALSFGVPARGEQGCSSVVPEWLASCTPSGRELLQTIVVETAALPLPLPPEYLSSAAKVSFRDFDAYARRSTLRSQETHSGNDEPEPNNEAPLPEVAVAPRNIDESSRDREAVAIAMVLLDDPHEGTDAAAKDVGELDRSLALAADSTAAIGIDSRDGSVDARASRAPAEAEVAGVAMAASVARKPSLADEGETDAAFAGTQTSLTEVFAFQADDRSARIAQVSASKDSTPSDLASVERVWTSLADVLGPQFEESPTAFETSEQQTAAPKRDVAFSAPVALAAVEPGSVASALPIDATSHASNALKRSIAAEDIVVASSHSEKILLSLAVLRSGADSGMGRFGTLAKNTVVVGQADKVLETLALFQSKRPKRAALACTRGSEEGIQVVTPRGSLKTWASVEQPGTSAVPASGPELEVTLDVLPPQSEQSAAPVLRAASAIPALPDRPAAGPNHRSAFGSDKVALSSDKLDEVRGGFVTDTGLKVSFGIERAVYLNGNLVTTTSLNVADLSKIAGGQAQVTGTGSGSLALVQSGAGNTFSPGSISSTSAGTVIQNTLDNQKINTITRIDAVVNSASIMRSINLQSSMRSAVIDSLRR